MAHSSALSSIEYEAESAWGEDVTTFATHRIPIIGAVDASGLVHTKVAPERAVQYRNDGTQWVLMTMGGSFNTKIDLAGHGATTAGSPSIDALETYLGIVFGTVELSAAASDTITGGTAAVPTTTAASGFDAGGLCRVGSLGDGDGDGQFYAITTHASNNLTLVGALNGAPVAAQVVYPVVEIYGTEAPTTSAITGTRFRLMTANLRYECHGCFPMSVAITGLSPGERPQIEITWGVSWWRYSTATFPSTVTSNQYNPAPIAAGSLNVQDVGTTTRNLRTFRNLQLNHTLGIEVLRGPGGVNAYQDIVGARRGPDMIKLSWTEDADAATTTPILPGYGTAATFKHIEYTGSPSAGSAFGFKMPRACVTNVAIQKADQNTNRLTIDVDAHTGTVTTNNLTLAAIVYGMS